MVTGVSCLEVVVNEIPMHNLHTLPTQHKGGTIFLRAKLSIKEIERILNVYALWTYRKCIKEVKHVIHIIKRKEVSTVL